MNHKTRPDQLPHEDATDFAAALEYTQGISGFRSELVEKDYFCSLVLKSIFSGDDLGLVFKGGTCLNKVYMGFFRLSEDLDFSVSVPVEAPRSLRSRMAKPIKSRFEEVVAAIPGLSVGQPLTGANNSTQYVGELRYVSCLSNEPGRVKIEVGLRETLCEPVATMPASTLAMNPFAGQPLVQPFNLKCLALREALAEKIRAIFTRKDVAIRDFFDYWHVHRHQKVDLEEAALLDMVVRKICDSTTPYVPLSTERVTQLNRQLTTDLRPVLTEKDFGQFILMDAISKAQDLEREIAPRLK